VPIGVQRGWESSFLESVFIILPGFAALQNARAPSGEFNRRFCQATTQAGRRRGGSLLPCNAKYILYVIYLLEYIYLMATEITVTDQFKGWFEGLNESEQEAVVRVVGLLEERGVNLEFPFSSGIKGSAYAAMRELRIQQGGNPYRVLYAFDPIRQAVLLVGGVKTGKGNRWYEEEIRTADRLFGEYLREE
jgi:hypothetical protein